MVIVEDVILTYKFRIYPKPSQTTKLENTLTLCRNLYNAALQERRNAWRLRKKSISKFDQQNYLPEIKEILPEYQEALGFS